jgi:Fe-S-cluster-containing dehydrogenase component/formate-dependent nitrite reductase membrane component NrfD
MPTFAFVIDNRKCIGCHACTVACKSEHQVPLGVDRTWVKYIEKGTFPNNRRFFSVMRCNHCERAPCVTICPVTALYHRDDGVVDFNAARCIGCKACMQACPYDALYIDPDDHTAAKCNFCAHRLDAGLQPSCVAVCPEQAIIAGDLDDPTSEISRLLDRHPVQVRKPEKGTRPKLFYIEADEASLVPTHTDAGGRGLWSRGEFVSGDGEPADTHARQALQVVAGAARRVYDVRPRPPAWGWLVAWYTWTKSLATGAMLAVLAVRLFSGEQAVARIGGRLAFVALAFLVATAALLVLDLKQPQRFLYVLLRPQWKSWLVRGAYGLTAYGALVVAWRDAQWSGATQLADVLLWPTATLAVFSAVYTAFLFAQARGRDFWQNPLLALHLLAHALLAGGAMWLLAEISMTNVPSAAPWYFTGGTLVFSLVALCAELVTTPPTTDAHLALDWIVRRPMGIWFWGAGIGAGHLLPIALLLSGTSYAAVLAAVLALMGMLVIERLWVLAPQQVPLS